MRLKRMETHLALDCNFPQFVIIDDGSLFCQQRGHRDEQFDRERVCSHLDQTVTVRPRTLEPGKASHAEPVE